MEQEDIILSKILQDTSGEAAVRFPQFLMPFSEVTRENLATVKSSYCQKVLEYSLNTENLSNIRKK